MHLADVSQSIRKTRRVHLNSTISQRQDYTKTLQKEKRRADESHVKKDRLATLIKKHLDSEASRAGTFDELLIEAVGDYMAELMEFSFIPHPQMDLVEEVLLEDSWDILRKITYGSLSLEDYRHLKSSKERRKKMSC